MRQWFLCLPIILSLSGCKKHFNLHYQTSLDLNVMAGNRGQPVMVGIYPLSRLPEDLGTLSCEALSTSTASAEALKEVIAREVSPVTFVPDERSVVKLPKVRGARWLLVVPFYEDKCGHPVDDWALMRTWPTTRSRSLTMSSFEIELPWEARPWRQRGCVDGTPSHLSPSVCE